MISVLMATLDGEAFVAEAIASVLEQRDVDLELVVTDDGSSDTTPEIVRELGRRDERVRFAAQPHAGAAAARNACMVRAQGSLIALLDQDDLCPPGKLARQAALLEAQPETAAVFGMTRMFGVGGERAPEYTMLLSAGLMRRTVVEAVGAFDASYGAADDLDFLLRTLEAGQRLELEPGLGTRHRRHPRQVSADLEATRRDCVRALAGSLRRRREAGFDGPLHHPLVAGAGLPS